jgi:uncharacterized protein (DUF433 family)
MTEDRIISNPAIQGGKPIIRGTRVPVEDIIEELAQGESVESVAKTFQVERDDIIACLKFAAKIVNLHWQNFLADPAVIDD